MFRSNQRHLQPALISNVNELPEKRRRRLEESWAGTFREQFFQRVRKLRLRCCTPTCFHGPMCR